MYMEEINEKMKLSILEKLSYNGLIDISDYEFYKYGLEVLVMNVLPIVVIALISIFSKNVIYGFGFLSAFIPIRIKIGGYHCSKVINCFLTFILIYIFSIVIQKYIDSFFIQIIGLISILLAFISKPLSYNFTQNYDYRINKVKNDVKIITASLVIIIFLISNNSFRNGIYIAYAINIILHCIGVYDLKVKGENNGNKQR